MTKKCQKVFKDFLNFFKKSFYFCGSMVWSHHSRWVNVPKFNRCSKKVKMCLLCLCVWILRLKMQKFVHSGHFPFIFIKHIFWQKFTQKISVECIKIPKKALPRACLTSLVFLPFGAFSPKNENLQLKRIFLPAALFLFLYSFNGHKGKFENIYSVFPNVSHVF